MAGEGVEKGILTRRLAAGKLLFACFRKTVHRD